MARRRQPAVRARRVRTPRDACLPAEAPREPDALRRRASPPARGANERDPARSAFSGSEIGHSPILDPENAKRAVRPCMKGSFQLRDVAWSLRPELTSPGAAWVHTRQR